MRQADRRRRLRATVMTNRHVRMGPRTPQITLSPPALVLFVLLALLARRRGGEESDQPRLDEHVTNQDERNTSSGGLLARAERLK